MGATDVGGGGGAGEVGHGHLHFLRPQWSKSVLCTKAGGGGAVMRHHPLPASAVVPGPDGTSLLRDGAIARQGADTGAGIEKGHTPPGQGKGPAALKVVPKRVDRVSAVLGPAPAAQGAEHSLAVAVPDGDMETASGDWRRARPVPLDLFPHDGEGAHVPFN